MVTLTLKQKLAGFILSLAAFIALVMIGGIWFSLTWMVSLWFWLVAIGCLVLSILFFITWQLDRAYEGIELEPEDLEDETEEEAPEVTPRAIKQPATIEKLDAPSSTKQKLPMQVQGVIQKPEKKFKAGTDVTSTPAPSKPAIKEIKDASAAPVNQETTTKKVPLASNLLANPTPEKQKKQESTPQNASKGLADQLASISLKKEVKMVVQEEEMAKPAKKVRLNRNMVRALIEKYDVDGYNMVSFNKIRNDLGVGKDKQALKLKKIILEAVGMGLLAKKGSKYIIQREGQSPIK